MTRSTTGRFRLLAAVTLTLALVAAGCGDDSDSSSGNGSSEDTSALALGTLDEPATQPTFDDIPMVASDAKPEKGTLRIYNYNDYINPEVISGFEDEYGVKVEVTGYDSEDEVTTKLNSGAVKVDLIMGITDSTLPRLAAGKLLQPLNPDLIPNSSNVIAGLQDPFYDAGAVYSRPYVIYKTGIGFRSDEVDPAEVAAQGWDILWNPEYKGYVGLLDDKREAISLALMHMGETDLNTNDQTKLDAAVADLDEMVNATKARVDAGVYQKVPEGTFHLSHSWSGDMLLGQQYLPDGDDVSVLGFWNPPITPVGNDMMTVAAGAEHPVLAHEFIDYLLDPEHAKLNFEYVGYQPALTSPSVQELIDAELIPENLRSSIVTDEELTNGLREYALDTPTETMWEDAWSTFKAG